MIFPFQVNGSDVTAMKTVKIIDLLRTVRGTVTITVIRQNFNKN